MSPELADALIMSRVRSQNGLINADPSRLFAADSANQAQNQLAVQSARQSLNLGQRRLDENARQFGQNMLTARNAIDYNQGQRRLATGLSTVGLGVGLLSNRAANKRFEEQMKLKQDMIDRLNKMTDQSSLLYANILKYLRF